MVVVVKYFSKKKLDTLTTDEMFSSQGSLFQLSQCLWSVSFPISISIVIAAMSFSLHCPLWTLLYYTSWLVSKKNLFFKTEAARRPYLTGFYHDEGPSSQGSISCWNYWLILLPQREQIKTLLWSRLERLHLKGLTGVGFNHVWTTMKASASSVEAIQDDYIKEICSLGS